MNGQDPNIQGNQTNLNNDTGMNPNMNNNMDSFVLGSVEPMDVNVQTPVADVPPVEVSAQTMGTMDNLQGAATVQPINNPTSNMAVDQTPMNNIPDANNLNLGPVDLGQQQVETPAQVPLEPQPIPLEMPSNEPALQGGMNFTNNVDSNGFVEPQKIENIGAMPPAEEPTKKKKPMNNILFIILIVALIAGVAYGVYYYLSISKSKSKISVNVKTVNVSLGEQLSDSINDYATFSGTNSTNCVLNKANVDTSKIGEYKYTITCGKNSYEGKVIVEDKVAPNVGTKVVYATVNSTVKPEDFIDYCKDNSECSYAFDNADAVNESLKNVGGPYPVVIGVKDTSDNTTKANGILYVIPYAMVTKLSCSSSAEDMTDIKATRTITDIMAIGSNGVEVGYLNAGRREYKYIFANAEEYNKIAANQEKELTLDGHTGLTTYNDEEKSITISTDLNNNILNEEAGGAFPTPFQDIRTYYESTKNYTCSTINE